MTDAGGARAPPVYLSKSTYIAGCQCPRRLWLKLHAPELGSASDSGHEIRIQGGKDVGRLAWDLFPGGVPVEEPPWGHSRALKHTRALLRDEGVPAIFEATCEAEGLRVRVDVLERVPGGWALHEVKSGTRAKSVHLDDIAVQWFVLERSGLALGSARLLVLEPRYVRGEECLDVSRLFATTDVTAEVRERAARVPRRAQSLQRLLRRSRAPRIEPDHHCFEPYICEFWAHCTRDKPDDWVWRLPRLGRRAFSSLRSAGVERIRDIPRQVPLSPEQERIREVVCSGHAFVSPALGSALAALGPPAWHLDFETLSPAIPLYPGTRPYETVPFQWSLHRVRSDRTLEHHEFLAGGRADPREELATRLLDVVSDSKEPVLVYSGYEARCLSELATVLPRLRRPLRRLRVRLVDLLEVVRDHVYHPAFRCSYSLKQVAPALVPGFRYEHLGPITRGDQAAQEFTRIASGECAPDVEASLRRALLAYCEHDTLALVRLHEALRGLAVGGGARA
jgi:hypothetical protein